MTSDKQFQHNVIYYQKDNFLTWQLQFHQSSRNNVSIYSQYLITSNYVTSLLFQDLPEFWAFQQLMAKVVYDLTYLATADLVSLLEVPGVKQVINQTIDQLTNLVHPSILPSIHQIDISVRPSIHPSVRQSVDRTTHPSNNPSIHPSIPG